MDYGGLSLPGVNTEAVLSKCRREKNNIYYIFLFFFEHKQMMHN